MFSRASRPVARLRRDTYDQFSEVPPLEQTDQRAWRRLEAVDDILAIAQAAVSHQRRTLLQECAHAVGVVADDEPANRGPVGENRSQVGARRRVRGVVLR